MKDEYILKLLLQQDLDKLGILGKSIRKTFTIYFIVFLGILINLYQFDVDMVLHIYGLDIPMKIFMSFGTVILGILYSLMAIYSFAFRVKEKQISNYFKYFTSEYNSILEAERFHGYSGIDSIASYVWQEGRFSISHNILIAITTFIVKLVYHFGPLLVNLVIIYLIGNVDNSLLNSYILWLGMFITIFAVILYSIESITTITWKIPKSLIKIKDYLNQVRVFKIKGRNLVLVIKNSKYVIVILAWIAVVIGSTVSLFADKYESNNTYYSDNANEEITNNNGELLNNEHDFKLEMKKMQKTFEKQARSAALFVFGLSIGLSITITIFSLTSFKRISYTLRQNMYREYRGNIQGFHNTTVRNKKIILEKLNKKYGHDIEYLIPELMKLWKTEQSIKVKNEIAKLIIVNR